jgi:WD40 repeat protein
MSKNGYLISCAYDNKIHFWDYFQATIIQTMTRRKEEFKCIAYVEKNSILYAGTNGKSILTFDISFIMSQKPQANFGSEMGAQENGEEDLVSMADSIDKRMR